MADVVATSPASARLTRCVKSGPSWRSALRALPSSLVLTVWVSRTPPRGRHTRTKSLANGIAITGIPDGGASLGALQCSVATDGSWEFAVTGVDGTTKNGTIVYAVVSSGQITSLTLTASTNKRFGTVNNPAGYTPSASKCLVKVGA